MNVFNLEPGMEFKNGETKITCIKHYVKLNKYDVKEISKELALSLNNSNCLNVVDIKTEEIDVEVLTKGYQTCFSIYFSSVKGSLEVIICDNLERFINAWTDLNYKEFKAAATF